MHIVHHCNIRCKNCSHFSPFAEEWVTEPDEIQKELQALTRKIVPKIISK
jgi:hypothetical protein